MKTNRRTLLRQRALIEEKLRPWTPLRNDQVPPSGWIKAMRGALGMNTRQLAQRLGVQQSTITRLEKREAAGDVTLNVIGRVAHAMNAKFVYAIVPDVPHKNVDAIVLERARDVARELVQRAEHSMRLEKQGTREVALSRQIQDLAAQLKSTGDSRIWWASSPQRPHQRK